MPTGFVVLGSPLTEQQHLLELGLALGADGDGNAPAQHWKAAGRKLEAMLARVLLLHSRQAEIGDAQGEPVLNSAQCVLRALRLCLEPKNTCYEARHQSWALALLRWTLCFSLLSQRCANCQSLRWLHSDSLPCLCGKEDVA